MTIGEELDRARHLAFAADEVAAKELLLSLIPEVEQDDRDDLMLEILAQLGEIYLVRTAYDGVEEAISRIDACLAEYRSLGNADQVAMSAAEIDHMICRYTRRMQFLRAGLAAAAHGDHESAEAALLSLTDDRWGRCHADLVDEHRFLITYAQIFCATALCDDDLHVQSIPLWEQVLKAIDAPGAGDEPADHLFVLGATNYGRFCVETGRLSEAEPWLRRAGARAEARDWDLATARTQLERATAAWAAGDRPLAQTLVHEAYPAIAKHARAHDVSRCWLYFGLISISVGALDDADERLGHAERHWREVQRPLHIHRILLQRSWVDILRGDFQAAADRTAEARSLLDSWPRRSWLQYARLDDHLGSILRAEALADPEHAAAKLARAAELKVPAALAVDSVRHAILDADARQRWATYVSARILAGAFAVAADWRNTELLSELIEYHCARGAFSAEPAESAADEWLDTATATVPVEATDDYALVAAGTAVVERGGLTRLGPLPPLRMEPGTPPILARYRELASQRYGRDITAPEAVWATWP
jgi:hypothetical protein